MAVEVAMETHLFRNTARGTEEEADVDETLAREDTEEDSSPVLHEPGGHEQHFFHNPLHDAESVWWGCIELLFKRRVEYSSLPELQQQYMEKYAGLQNASSSIFPDEPSLGSRQVFLSDRLRYREIMSHLPPSLKRIGDYFSKIRDHLVFCYAEAEQTDDGTICAEVYRIQVMFKFASLLMDTRPLARGKKLAAFPKEWNTQVSPSPGEKNATQRAGPKRKASNSPDSCRKVRRTHGESAPEA
jgi:hypothetical protein